jgi:uncharacterized damage-inducible protein DinB
MPDQPEYLTRIRGHVGLQNPLQLQRQAPSILAELIRDASGDRFKTRPSRDKWSIGEILAHLAEDEIATAWRYRQMVEHSGIELNGFDQNFWAQAGGYESRDPQESLALFRLLRGANLQFLEALTTEQWECFGIHTERGRITVRDLAVHMAGHDINHIEQVRRILAANSQWRESQTLLE